MCWEGWGEKYLAYLDKIFKKDCFVSMDIKYRKVARVRRGAKETMEDYVGRFELAVNEARVKGFCL